MELYFKLILKFRLNFTIEVIWLNFYIFKNKAFVYRILKSPKFSRSNYLSESHTNILVLFGYYNGIYKMSPLV